DKGLLTCVEANVGNGAWAVGLYDYDLKTGNLIATTKPEQVANGSARKTTLGYDPFGIYVIRTVNELGHEVLHTYDLGTGALLTERGPNSKLVGGNPVWEMQTWGRDGLGRVLEHAISVDDARLGYRQVTVEQFEYRDSQRLETERRLLDFNSPRWTSGDRLHDGWGRL